MKNNTDTFIHSNYAPTAIAEARSLYAFNSGKSVPDNDTENNHLTIFDLSKTYNVVIKNPFSKKQISQCDCTPFIQEGQCKHIIFGLMQLTDRYVDSQELDIPELQVKSIDKKLTRLSTKDIIASVKHQELIDFLVAYARTDAKVSTAIKVHFARQIEVGNDIDKYKSILNAIIKPITDSQAKVNIADLRSLCLVLDDFWGQMQDCLALGQYMEAYNIFVASFDKLNYVRHHATTMVEKLTVLSQKYHNSIPDFLREKIAPELRITFVQYLIEVAQRSYYHFYDPKFNIIYQLAISGRKSDQALLSALLHHLAIPSNLDESCTILALNIYINNKVDQDIVDTIQSQKTPVIGVINALEVMKAPSLALALGKHFYSKNRDIDKTLTAKMSNIYIGLNNEAGLHKHLVNALVKTYDFKLFETIKYQIDNTLAHSILTEVVNNVPKNEKSISFKVNIYKELGDIENVIDCVQSNIANLALLKSVENYLYSQDHQALLQLYVVHLNHYLDNHIGDNTHDYLKALRIHMTHNKLDKLIIPMVKMLSEKFGHRPSLAKAFALLI